jgi:hypothetical protein
MITFKSNGLSKKEEAQIFGLFQEANDPFGDFYVTKNNLRLFIKENIDVFFSGLKQGDKIAFDINGLAAVIGFSDKSPRKYLKILSKDLELVPSLVKTLYWHVKTDLFCKVKGNNPLKDVLLHCGFSFIGERGKEVLLVHHYVARPAPNYTFVKDRDEDE